ncbi:ATP-dependent RNA helicase SUV3 [Sarocladium implicatum]|nr:ATP-dependent RNA helicase SUV3 [Sarocladium implicatum]
MSTTTSRYRISSRNDGKPNKSRLESRAPSQSKWEARSREGSAKPGSDPTSRARVDFGKKYKGRYALLRAVVLTRFQRILDEMQKSASVKSGLGEDELNRHAANFMDLVDNAFLLAESSVTRQDRNPLFWTLRDSFINREIKGLHKEIHFAFQNFLMRQRHDKAVDAKQQEMVDFRFPHEWFPATRALQRTIHVHVGPTNSGKTYQALKALENARTGYYAGPLRLLATETYHRLLARGKPCALITGEEILIPDDTDVYFQSCTVEMLPLNNQVDVCVIDEIQMLEDPVRGSAWTTALLGVQAKEVHVCGEERAVSIVKALCAATGDKCIVHRYERLSPLETAPHSISGDYHQLRKGDAVVAFNRLTLHALKRNIESITGRRCAIVYGGLPPEVRVQQAALFNDPDNDYDFIAASDAIGMGLNLEIRRVVMESVTKFDGIENRILTVPEMKQIGGRAGRFRSARNASATSSTEVANPPGVVTTMDPRDIRFVQRSFRASVPDIKRVGLQPPVSVVEHFASYYPPDTPLSFIMMRIKLLAKTTDMYNFIVPEATMELADLIHDIPMTIGDRLIFCNMPTNLRAVGAEDVARALAKAISTNSNGDLLEMNEIPLEVLDVDINQAMTDQIGYLWKLESLHMALSQYIWLSYRYSGIFSSQAVAIHAREKVAERLVEVLERMDFTEAEMTKLRSKHRRKAETTFKKRSALVRQAGVTEEEESAIDAYADASPLSMAQQLAQ